MSDETDLSEVIEQAVTEPASASKDGISGTNRPIPDLIAASKFLAGNKAMKKNPTGGLIFRKIVPPGSR